MVKYGCERKSIYDVLNQSNGCDDYNNDTEGDRLDALNNVQEFFASYDEGEGEGMVDNTENPMEWSSMALEEEAREAEAEAEVEADDDFEKI